MERNVVFDVNIMEQNVSETIDCLVMLILHGLNLYRGH